MEKVYRQIFLDLLTGSKIQRFIFLSLGLLLLLSSCKTPKLEVYNRHHRPGLYVDLQMGFKQNRQNKVVSDNPKVNYRLNTSKQSIKPIDPKIKEQGNALAYAPLADRPKTGSQYPIDSYDRKSGAAALEATGNLLKKPVLGYSSINSQKTVDEEDKEKEKKIEPFGVAGLITALLGGGAIGAAFLASSIALGVLGFLILGLGEVFAIVSIVRIGENEDKFKGLFFGIVTIGLVVIGIIGAYLGLIIAALFI